MVKAHGRATTSRQRLLIWLTGLAVVAAGALVGLPARADGSAPEATPNGWTLGLDGGSHGAVDGTVTVETSDVHTGGHALRFTRTEAWSQNHYLFARQYPDVQPNTDYTLSVWVKSDRTISAKKSASITVTGWKPAQRLLIPTGTYDWQRLTKTFTTGADQTSLEIYILDEVPTHGLIIDDLSLTAPDGHDVITNGGFEDVTDTVHLTNDSLLLPLGHAVLHFTSTSAHVTWSVIDSAGVTVTSGTTDVAADGSGSVDLTGLGVGFYTVAFTTPENPAGEIPSAPVAIMADTSPHNDPRLGVAAHPAQDSISLAYEAAQMGFSAVRTDARWRDIETTKGSYTFPALLQNTVDAFAQHGIAALPITESSNKFYDDNLTPSSPEGLAAFGRFAAAVDAHFHTGMLEAFNEPNVTNFNTSACGATGTCYAEIQKAVYQAVKAASPDTVVTGPALGGPNKPAHLLFLKKFFAAGGLDNLDVVSIHPYIISGPPEVMDQRIAEVRQLMKQAGAPDKPIWITEDGWSVWPDSAGVTEEVQADYLIRSEALAFADGVSKYFWYELNNISYNTSAERSNFGLIRTPTATSSDSPRPAALAQAVFAQQIAGKPFTARLQTPKNVYGLTFGSGDAATNVLWSTKGTAGTVSLRTRTPLTVTDREGHVSRLAPVHGRVTLRLTGSPVFVAGALPDPRPASPLFTVTPTQAAFGTGVGPTVSLDVHRSARSLPGPLTFHLPSGDYQVPTSGRGALHTTVELPARAVEGHYPVQGVVTDATGREVGRVDTTLSVTTPVATGWQPTRDGGLAVTVANNTTDPLTVSSVSWRLGEQAGTTGASRVAAGATGRIDLPVELPDYHHAALTATVHFADGTTSAVDATGAYNPVWPHSDHHPTAIELPGGTQNTQPAPSDGNVIMSYDRGGITITATVTDTDDQASQTLPGEMWRDDSLQLVFAPGMPGTDHRRSELTIGRVDGRTTVYLNRRDAVFGNTQGAVMPDIPASVQRSGDTTTYRVTVPWHIAYAQGHPGEVLSLSWLINNNDGGTRGWAAWGGGIAHHKNNAELNAVVLR